MQAFQVGEVALHGDVDRRHGQLSKGEEGIEKGSAKLVDEMNGSRDPEMREARNAKEESGRWNVWRSKKGSRQGSSTIKDRCKAWRRTNGTS